MKTKQTKREEAEVRNAKYQALSTSEKKARNSIKVHKKLNNQANMGTTK